MNRSYKSLDNYCSICQKFDTHNTRDHAVSRRACIGGLPLGTVVKFQDVRDELRGDNFNVVKAQVVHQAPDCARSLTTTVRRIGDNKKFILHKHHMVEIV